MRLLVALVVVGIFVRAQTPVPPKNIHIDGRVVSVTGEAISRATATLRPVDGGVPVGSIPNIATNNEGKFAFDDIPPGRYMLSFQKAGFLTQAYGARGTPNQGTVLNLTAGADLKDLVTKLTPQGVISGKILDQDGDPVAGAGVRLMQYRYVQGRRSLVIDGTAIANDQGDYRISNVTPGSYYVCVTDVRTVEAAITGARRGRAETESNVPTFYPNATEATNGKLLDITAGSELRGIDIRMRRARVYSVKGKVVIPAGGVLTPGTSLAMMPKGTDESSLNKDRNYSTAMVQLDGTFDFRNLRPGTFELLAGPTPLLPNGEPGPGFAPRMDVTVTVSNIEGLVVTLNRLGEITGTIGVEDGDLPTLLKAKTPSRDPPGILVRLFESDGVRTNSPLVRVKDDGRFRITSVSARKHSFDITRVPDGSYVKSVRFGGRDVTRTGLDNTSGAGGTMQIILSPKAADVSGVLRNDKREPLRGATVSLWPKTPDLGSNTGGVRQGYTDQDGGFKFTSLAPGEYYVAAWEDIEPGLAQGAEFLARFNREASPIKLDESAHATVSLKVIPQARLAAEIAKLP